MCLKILAIESSAVCASAAILQGGKIIAESFVNAGLTHSQTLLPLVESCLDSVNTAMSNIDMVAVANGPGSFTGVRIGVAAAKGLAFSGIECCGVSTPEAMAYNLSGLEGTACCVMDARCSQVYTALFDCGEKVTRLCEDKAVMLSDLPEMIKNCKKPVYLLGDGAEMCYNHLKCVVEGLEIAPTAVRYQRAASVALAAFSGAGDKTSADKLVPTYLRVPQAERELKKKRSDS